MRVAGITHQDVTTALGRHSGCLTSLYETVEIVLAEKEPRHPVAAAVVGQQAAVAGGPQLSIEVAVSDRQSTVQDRQRTRKQRETQRKRECKKRKKKAAQAALENGEKNEVQQAAVEKGQMKQAAVEKNAMQQAALGNEATLTLAREGQAEMMTDHYNSTQVKTG